MNRGSHASGQDPVRRRERFNEAPIHESGKLTTHAMPSSAMRCFNEAPIHESGKYPWSLRCCRSTIGLQ